MTVDLVTTENKILNTKHNVLEEDLQEIKETAKLFNKNIKNLSISKQIKKLLIRKGDDVSEISLELRPARPQPVAGHTR